MNSYRNSETRLPVMQGSPPALIPQKMDWDRPPWNRWAFQNVREILPTTEVWRGTGEVRILPRADRDLDGLAVKGVAGDTATLSGLLDETYTDGFLVIKNGAIVYERYFNGMTSRSLHLSQSMAKSVTASAAGVLVGRGLQDHLLGRSARAADRADLHECAEPARHHRAVPRARLLLAPIVAVARRPWPPRSES